MLAFYLFICQFYSFVKPCLCTSRWRFISLTLSFTPALPISTTRLQSLFLHCLLSWTLWIRFTVEPTVHDDSVCFLSPPSPPPHTHTVFGFPWINTLPHLAIGFAYSIPNISPSSLKKAPNNNNSNTPARRAHVWPPASRKQSEGRGRGRYSLHRLPLSSCFRMASSTLHRAWQLGPLPVNLFRDSVHTSCSVWEALAGF